MTRDRFTLLMTISACVAALAASIAFTPAANATGKATSVAIPAAAENSSEKISIRPVKPIIMMVPGPVPVPAAGSQLTRDREAIFGI
jgi:hypothetical protein